MNKSSEVSDMKNIAADIKEEFAIIRQDLRDWRNDLIKVGFLLSVAQVLIVLTVALLIS